MVFKNKEIICFIFMAFLFPAGGASASFRFTYPDSLGVYGNIDDTLNQVVITARNTHEIAPVQSLSGEKLQKLSTFSVSDALRYFSGVQIKDYGGIGGLKTINVRSMGSQHVGVFYDGVQITNAQNGTVDLGRFSMDNMEVLSVYNGQKSAVFQSAKDFSSASALYMVSRRPVFEDAKNNNWVFRGKTGSFDLGNVSALWEHRYNGHVSSSVNAEFLSTSGKYKFRYSKDGGYDTTEVRRNGDVTSFRGEAAVFGKYEKFDWFGKVYFYESERGYPGAAVKKDYGISLLNEDRQHDRNFFAQSSFTYSGNDFYSLKFQAKYSKDYMNYIMPPHSTVQPANNKYWQDEIYFSAAGLLNLTDFWSVNISGDYQWNRLDACGSDMFDANFSFPRRHTVLAAAATSARLPFGLSAQASLLYTFVHDESARNMEVAPDKSIFTPSLILSYKPWKKLGLEFRAFYKNIFRMPTFNDLYYVQIGNRLLRPEYAVQYDVGAVYRKSFQKGVLESLDLSVDGYFNQVKDKIIATPTSNQLVWTMLNLGYVEILGTDVTASIGLRFGEFLLSGRLSYTYQNAVDLTENKKDEDLGEGVVNVYGDQIPYIPWHSGSVTMNCVFRNWDLNYSFIYTGERYMLGGNIPVNYIQPWYTSDIAVSRKFTFSKFGMKASLEVNNLFNQQYEVVKWYPMPGTNFKIVLTFEL